MTHIDVLSDFCRGHPVERAIVVPISPWGIHAPIVIAEGDSRHCAYDPRDVVRAVQATGCQSLAFCHNHPTHDRPRPSFGDLSDAATLQRTLGAWTLHLTDICVVNMDGRVFSFAHEGILTNPIREGRRFAEEAQRLVASRH